MGKVYDDWGRLVEAVLRREKLRQLCYAHSATSSDCSSVLDHNSLQLHAAKTTMVRLQEEVIRILTLHKQFFEDGYMSPPTCESRQCMSSEVEECLVELLDPDTIPRIEAMFSELSSVIRVHPPPIPSPDGGIHPLTRHVVGYVLCFEEYDLTLNWILEDMFWGGLDAGVEQSMLAAHLHSITSCLEGNIASISGLYDHTSLQHVFMMNNIHYMVEKIGKSKMRAYFGDEWKERGFEKYESHALGYRRRAWSSLLSLLHLWKVDGATIKTRCSEFTEAFEKAREDQTGLFVPNLELLQELRISASATRDKYPNKNMQDRQRNSVESSWPSFSCSFSSLGCNKATQLEAGSIDRMVFPETPSRDPATSMQSTSLEFSRQSLDLLDDSIYRETQGLSVKSRPPLVKKPSTPADTKESVRILAKLQEAPRYNYEPRAFLRSSSYHSIEGSSLSISKDAPPLSYDGREGSNSAVKLKDLLGLPLDNEECLMRSLGADSNSNFLSISTQKDSGVVDGKGQNRAQHKSVIAKLMGLDSLTDYDLPIVNNQLGSAMGSFSFVIESCSSEKRDKTKQFQSLRKNSEVKPMSWLPIEPAPWKYNDGTKMSQKPARRNARASSSKTPTVFPSLYSETSKRLRDLEFSQSGKDLRALKQILEAMQAKGLLETRSER